jgi:hypothetical protein
LDVDFNNDAATINALSADVLNTNIRTTGTVTNYKNPQLDLALEAADLDLGRLREIMPQLVDQYGLVLDGSASVKARFKGPALQPLKAGILAKASFKNINAESTKLHQRIKNISGSIEATPDSLRWQGITAFYQGRKYVLTGQMTHFKAPRIITTLSGPNMELKMDVSKQDDLLTINSLTGKYLNTEFGSKGTVLLAVGRDPIFDISSHASFLLEDMVNLLPESRKKSLQPLNPSGMMDLSADLKGTGSRWQDYTGHATLSSPTLTLMGYHLDGMKISVEQEEGKIKNAALDGTLYDGTVHAVGSLDLLARGMPYDLAINIANTDMHKLKMDSPLKMEEIDGKFFLTTVAHGTVSDFKNKLTATGSAAIRDGFLAQFNLFKGLLGVLNDALRIGQIEITDVDGNFTIGNQKINTDNLRLKGPTIVLLSRGWVNFGGICDLNVTVDLSSGIVPAIAHDVLNTLNIRIYDRIENPKFKKKISVPQVINSLLKNLLQ